MGRGARMGMKQSSDQPLRKKIVDSEDSDEDYVAEADEVDEQSDDVVSLVGDASEEELDVCDEDYRKGGRRAVVKPRAKPKPKTRVQKGVSRSKKNGANRPKKRGKFTCDDDDSDNDADDDDDMEFTPDECEYPDQKGVARIGRNGVNRPKKRRKFTCDNDDDSDNDDDVEFTPDEIEYPDQTEVSRSGRNGVNRPKKRRKFTCDETDDDDDSDNDAEDDVEFTPDEIEYPDQTEVSRSGRNGVNRPKKRRKFTCDDDDDSDNEAEDDVEFTPDEIEYPDQTEVSRSGRNGVNRPKKRIKFTCDDDDDSDNEAEDDVEFTPDESEYPDQKGVSRSGRNGVNRPKKRRKFTCDDDDDDSDNDADDEEFTPDEFEYLEEEEEDDDDEEEEEELFPKAKINTKNRRRTTLKRKKPVKTQKKRRAKTGRKPSKTRSKRTSSSRKKTNSGVDKEFLEKGLALRGRTRRKLGHKKKNVIGGSDFESDACSDSSDHDFTISEEEREQIREANLFCRTVDTDLRSSRKNQDDEAICEPKKPPVRKGKEKAGEKSNDVGKPVCGICLTEEGKSTVRGTLNCCSHHFCFACIMEWSKVETRCPLCKQRFVTISKPTKCTKGVDLRNAMITVPERDQVYQPSEEELRDFLNPYENVICTECNLGGDDALMLLCDVCDSPAHTYCVGLGREVPEGNWYCDGCRPAALASLSQTQDRIPDQRSGAGSSGRLSTYENMAEIDLNVTIPETQLSQGDGLLYSPRYSGGSLQVPSPVSGIGVSTVSGRRRIHRQIHNILSNRMSQTGGEISSLGSMTSHGVNTAFQRSRSDVGTSRHAPQAVRFEENLPHSVQNMGFSPGRLGSVMGHVGQSLTVADTSALGHRAWGGLESIRLEATQAQLSASDPLGPLLPCTSRSSIGPYSGGYSSENREDHTNFVKHQVHSIVSNQLISMCSGMNLGHNTLVDISRICVHTIMAAYGLEPRRHDTYGVQPPICVHLRDRLANVAVSPLNGCCLVCFQGFVKVIVERIMHISIAPHWQFFRH